MNKEEMLKLENLNKKMEELKKELTSFEVRMLVLEKSEEQEDLNVAANIKNEIIPEIKKEMEEIEKESKELNSMMEDFKKKFEKIDVKDILTNIPSDIRDIAAYVKSKTGIDINEEADKYEIRAEDDGAMDQGTADNVYSTLKVVEIAYVEKKMEEKIVEEPVLDPNDYTYMGRLTDDEIKRKLLKEELKLSDEEIEATIDEYKLVPYDDGARDDGYDNPIALRQLVRLTTVLEEKTEAQEEVGEEEPEVQEEMGEEEPEPQEEVGEEEPELQEDEKQSLSKKPNIAMRALNRIKNLKLVKLVGKAFSKVASGAKKLFVKAKGKISDFREASKIETEDIYEENSDLEPAMKEMRKRRDEKRNQKGNESAKSKSDEEGVVEGIDTELIKQMMEENNENKNKDNPWRVEGLSGGRRINVKVKHVNPKYKAGRERGDD